MQKERPLSPHIQVYNMFQITSLLSIMHRGTGIFLALGTPLLVYWLTQVAAGPSAFQDVQALFAHWFVQLVMLGWTFALFYHLCNGIRHLFWDAGKGFDLPNLRKSGIAVVVVASVLTVATAALAVSGGLA